MAYGTQSIPKVDVITGPGNIFVATAKKLVYGEVNIDMIAGPSEIGILADESARDDYLAMDLLSQAEHDEMASSILITTSSELAHRVSSKVEEYLSTLSREEIARKSIEQRGAIIVTESMDRAIELMNAIAPEHLEVMTENPAEIAGRITSAGVILTGNYSPASASDYCLGTNHILPTGGYGHVFSGLSVLNFVKITNVIECSRDGLIEVRDQITTLALAEGLPNHASAVEGRVQLEG